MTIRFNANQIQPIITKNKSISPKDKKENFELQNTTQCYNKENEPLPPDKATQKLEEEIAKSEQELKAKLDHYIKILEQLGEPTLTQINNTSDDTAQIPNGNPHVDGFAQLLNTPMPQKGSLSPEEGVKILENRLKDLQKGIQDIDNDIREATLRLMQQQADTNIINTNPTTNGGGLATSQARLLTLHRS